jgi:hypothetical protein
MSYMSRSRILFGVTLVASLQLLTIARAETHYSAVSYNAVNEFSLQSNPNGVWTYMDGSAPMTFHHRHYDGASGVEAWSNDLGDDYRSSIVRNKTGQTLVLHSGTTTFPTNYLLMDPEGDGAIVQFQAPIAGSYFVKGNFLNLTSRVHHAHRVAIFETDSMGNYIGAPFTADTHGMKPKKFKFSIALAAGYTLQFYVGLVHINGQVPVGLQAKITGP